jgi:hypothetical protein
MVKYFISVCYAIPSTLNCSASLYVAHVFVVMKVTIKPTALGCYETKARHSASYRGRYILFVL